ncbi:MAG: BatD family protein, partial [Cyanobacteriota bacterium]
MHSVYKSFIIAVLIILILPLACISQPFAKSWIDKYKLTVDDYITLTVEVSGASGVEQPQLMGMNNFKQVSVSTSQQLVFMNNQQSSSFQYKYVLKPLNTGDLKIGEAYINTSSGRLYTKPITITVDKSNVNPITSNISSKNNSNDFLNASTDSIFLKADVDDKNPYKNQQIIYTVKLYFTGNIADVKFDVPTFTDFLIEPLDQIKQYTTYAYGNYYSVVEQTYAMFPAKTGKIEIPPAVLTAQHIDINDPFNSMFGNVQYQPVKLNSEAISLNVKELPTAPAGFKNSVGEFKIDTKIDKVNLEVGESAKLKIIVWGRGNILNVQSPEFAFDKEFRKNFKIYPSHPVTQITDKKDYIYGQKVFNFDLVALNPGNYDIPSAEYAYFNPDTKMYHQVKSSTIEVEVSPSTKKETLGLTASDNLDLIDNSNPFDDIIQIHKSNAIIKNNQISKTSYILFVIILALPILALFFTFVYIKHKEYNEANQEIIKKRYAYRKAKDAVNKLKPL